MELAIRDAAAIITLLNGVLLLARQRTAISVGTCIFLGILVWLVLFRGEPNFLASIGMLIIFGYLFVSGIGLVSSEAISTRNAQIVRLFFGKRAYERWQTGMNRMQERERAAGAQGISVIEILKQEHEDERKP